ncbi:MAG: ABC transporter substrate-binding protein, partial [Oscillospiraceae bacterium]
MKRQIIRLLALALVLCVCFSAVACGKTEAPVEGGQETGANEATMFEGKTIKIGVFVPLSGTTADKGNRIKDSVMLATEKLNAAGGIYGGKVEIIVEDDEGVAASAVSAVTKLVTNDGCVALLGSNPSSCTVAAMSISAQNEVPQIAPNSSSPKIGSQDGNDWIFQTIPSDAIQAKFLAKYFVDDCGYKRIAIIAGNDDYGQGGAKGAIDALKEYGLEPVVVESYTSGDKDFTAQITNIKNAKPDALFGWGAATEAALIRVQLAEQGMPDLPCAGAGGIPGTTYTELAGKYGEGQMCVNTFLISEGGEAAQAYVKEFEEKYGYEPDLTNAQAYDGINMLFDSIKRAKSLDSAA